MSVLSLPDDFEEQVERRMAKDAAARQQAECDRAAAKARAERERCARLMDAWAAGHHYHEELARESGDAEGVLLHALLAAENEAAAAAIRSLT
jgi:hypothetical protein